MVHLRERLRTASLTARSIPSLRRISPRTLSNRLRERGIRPRRPAIRPVLQQRHRVARFGWCRRHIHFTQQDWACIRFMDESISTTATAVPECTVLLVNVSMTSCVIERRPYGGGSVMVWGGISSRGRTAIVVVDGTLTDIRYRDEIIQAHGLPFVPQHNATL